MKACDKDLNNRNIKGIKNQITAKNASSIA